MKRIVLVFLLTFTACALLAQDKAGKIFVKGKAKDGKIYLRWATDDISNIQKIPNHTNFSVGLGEIGNAYIENFGEVCAEKIF